LNFLKASLLTMMTTAPSLIRLRGLAPRRGEIVLRP